MRTKRMNCMKMELLIEMVRENKVLYDTSHNDYMRTKYKDEIWEEISRKLNYSCGQEVKEIWKKLRDCHRDALRRQEKRKSGDAAKPIKLWTYQKQMEYLIPYMANRKTTGNVDISQDERNNSSENILVSPTSDREDIERANRQDQVEESRSEGDIGATPETPNMRSKKRKIDVMLQNTLEDYSTRRKERDEERKRILSYFEKNAGSQNEDGLYQFFLAMYNDTKKMSKISQLRIRRKIFEAVQLEEELNLRMNSSQVVNHTTHRITGIQVPSPSCYSSSTFDSTVQSPPQELNNYGTLRPAAAEQSYHLPPISEEENSLPSYFGNFRYDQTK